MADDGSSGAVAVADPAPASTPARVPASAAELAGIEIAAWKAALGATSFKNHQLHPTPSPGAGDRVFYESLYVENPACEMALIWCIEHGVFLAAEHDRLVPAYERAKASRKKGIPAATSAVSTNPGGVKKPTPAAKRSAGVVHDSSAIAVDVGMSHGGTEEVGGRITF